MSVVRNELDTPAAAAPVREMEEIIVVQDKTVAGLHDTVERLISRLHPVILPHNSPDARNSDSAPATLRSELGARFEANTESVCTAIRRLADLIDRLAV